MRVATRDTYSGRTGSAIAWIEIPQVEPDRLTMSSLFLVERPEGTPAALPNHVNVDRRFSHSSVLRFQTSVYNASRKSGEPDVSINASVFRGGQQVMSTAPQRIPPDVSKDSWRLPYWSEIVLNRLPPGAYTLQVSATDKAAGTSASQKMSFSVE